MGPPNQGKRQPGEQDRSGDKNVRYSFCWSIENRFACLYQFLYRIIVTKLLLNYFVILRGSCFKIYFAIIILKILNLLQMFVMGVCINLLLY